MAATLKSKVQRGAKLLDEAFPGWAYRVRLRGLDLSCPDDCVLGQMFERGYWGGLCALEEASLDGRVGSAPNTISSGQRFGAEGAANWGFDARRGDYERLDELWSAEIRARRGRGGTNARDDKLSCEGGEDCEVCGPMGFRL